MANEKAISVRASRKETDGRRKRTHPGQCTKCRKILPLTKEFFHAIKRRGREEFRNCCKQCFSAQVAQYQKTDAYRLVLTKARSKPRARENLRRAWQKFHAKPEYREYDRALYRRLMESTEGREKLRVKVRKRRARVKGAPGYHTADDIQIAMEVQQGCCFYCQTDVSIKYTVDHLIPLVRGGSDGPENIVIACPNCNFRKADKTPQEFAAGIKHRRKSWRSELPA